MPVFKLLIEVLMVASIEAPFTLLEKPMKIVRFDAIESSQMSFGLVPKVFDPVDVISPVGEELGMIVRM
jgi:hypothetical protein